MISRILFPHPNILSPIINLPKSVLSRNKTVHFTFQIAGNREQVGYGYNGNPEYHDRTSYPFPAVKWREPTPELCCLWEKEKGDWKQLSKAEKKALYRASFRQTFSEIHAPTGMWKAVVGKIFLCFSLALWIWFYIDRFVLCSLPHTFCEKEKATQLRRILDLQTNPIQGMASYWDYEKDNWKYGRKY